MVHSLFRFEIDEISGKGFISNDEHGPSRAERLMSADLIVIDNVSMLAHLVLHIVSLTLQSISDRSHDSFGQRKILSVWFRDVPSNCCIPG
jgi:hypothetical protein